MNNQQSLPFSRTFQLDSKLDQSHTAAANSERAITTATMIGAVAGAVLMTLYCRTFLESNVAMAMGMIGAVGGALLATLLAPVALTKHHR